MIKWAGWLMVALGVGHMLTGLALTIPRHAGTWFSGGLWGADLATMGPASGAFWLTIGSFGVPHILIGLMVLWLDRRGITPPQFIGWTLLATSVVGAIIWEPAPWPVGWISSGLLLAGIRRANYYALRASIHTDGD